MRTEEVLRSEWKGREDDLTRALLTKLDLDPEEKIALEKTLEVIRYLNEAKVDPVELFVGE